MTTQLDTEKEQLLDDYVSYVEPRVSTLTLRNYKSQVRKFLREYELTDSDMLEYVMRGAQKRAYVRKQAMRLFALFIGREDIAQKIQATKYQVKNRKRMETLTYDEVVELVERLKEYGEFSLAVVIMLCFDTGARIRAILRVKERDFKEGETPSVELQEKNGKFINRYITQDTYRHVEELLTGNPQRHVFIGTEEIREGVSTDDISTVYSSMYKLLRAVSEKTMGKSVSFHWIRRASGVYWYQKTDKNIRAVQELYSHPDPGTTARYLRLEGEEIKERMKHEKREW